jgi:hypothetical protein
MWLIDVDTYKLVEFFSPPRYAILSHRWGDEEVSFEEMMTLDDMIRSKKGFIKIQHTVNQAKTDNLHWAWVDACCIDKKSSAELSEAINSMYRWYNEAAVCYVYLSDVLPSGHWYQSEWFTRSWTLQELIAPRYAVFYNHDWVRVGEKGNSVVSSKTFTEYQVWNDNDRVMLSRITGIPYDCLFGPKSIRAYSLGQRMSWAARRTCSRVEDTAYSLLGLFDINMPLLYGEREKAFQRLQEEILKTTDDHSILAWTHSSNRQWPKNVSVLARSPAQFVASSNTISTHEEVGELSAMTKQGLRIELETKQCRPGPSSLFFRLEGRREFVRAKLNCTHGETPSELLLIRDVSAPGGRWWHRLASSKYPHPQQCEDSLDDAWEKQVLFIRNKPLAIAQLAFESLNGLYFQNVRADVSPSTSPPISSSPTDQPYNKYSDKLIPYEIIAAERKYGFWDDSLHVFVAYSALTSGVFLLRHIHGHQTIALACLCKPIKDITNMYEFSCDLYLNPPSIEAVTSYCASSTMTSSSTTIAAPDGTYFGARSAPVRIDDTWQLSASLYILEEDHSKRNASIVFSMDYVGDGSVPETSGTERLNLECTLPSLPPVEELPMKTDGNAEHEVEVS